MSSPSVWIFNHYASAPDRPGGTRHLDLARGLIRRGFRVTIFAAGFSHVAGVETRVDRRRLYRTEEIEGVRFVWVRTFAYRGNTWRRFVNMLSFAGVALVAQRRLRRPDVVIGSTVHPFAAAAALVVTRLRGARFMFEIRDLWPQTLVDMGVLRRESIVARSLWWLEAILVRQAEVVITLLPLMHDYLHERQLPTDRTLYLPNGVRLDGGATSVAPRRISEAIKRLRADRAFVFGYLGAHGRANGLDVVLHAAAELQRRGDHRIHVVFIGDGPEKQGLIALAETLALDNVTFMDPVNKTEVPAVLNLIDAGILHLSDIDVFRYGISPNKLFDYLASRRPVVFACRSGMDPISEAHAGISVPPGDPAMVAAGMLALASEQEPERRRMGIAGRRYVEQNHDIDRLSERLAQAVTAGATDLGDGAHRQ